MILLPFEHITYRTKLSPEEVIERLEKVVKPTMNLYGKAGFAASEDQKPYRGTINRDSFRINRIITKKNSFLPMINGRINRINDKTEIEIKMKPEWSALLFMIFWLFMVGFFLFSSFDSTTFLKNGISLSDLIPLGMFLGGYGMTIFGFKSESIKSKKFLTQLFEAETKVKTEKRKRKSPKSRYLK